MHKTPFSALLVLACLAPAAPAAGNQTIAAGGVVLWVAPDGAVFASGDAETARGDARDGARRHFEPIDGLRDVVSVALQRDGDDGAAALDRAGRVWAWGRVFCPFAATRTDCESTPHVPRQLPGFSDITAIAAGGEHLLALDAQGRVLTIGDNQYGQLGTGDTERRGTATAIADMDGVVAIAASGQNSYFMRRDGSVWGAGLGWGGMLGPTARAGGLFDGLDEKSVNAKPLRIEGPTDIVAISAGNNFVVARDREGLAWGWGGNDSAQLGQPASDLGIVAPRRLRGFDAVIDVAAGYDFVLAATATGEVIAQGGNVYGTLGDGRGELEGERRTIAGIDDARRVFAGHYNAFAQRGDASFVGWGANDAGIGGFAPQRDDGAVPPTALDASARPAAASDLVRAGGVSLPIRIELGIDQRSERVRISIDGREPVELVVDADNADALARIELPVGAHAYTLDGAAVMANGDTRPIEGGGVLVVSAEPMSAVFEAVAQARGVAAAFDTVKASLGESFAARSEAHTRITATGPMSADALDQAQAELPLPMPAAYRQALQQLGPFALRLGSSPFPSVALHAPDSLQTLTQWLAQARATIKDPPRDGLEEDLAWNLGYFAANLDAQAQAPWMGDRVAATLPESTLYLLTSAGRCDDGAARERLAAFFEPRIDEDTGEERHFAWADDSECGMDLARLLRTTAGEGLLHHYRTLGALFLSAADPDSLGAGAQREDDSGEGVLRLRLAQ